MSYLWKRIETRRKMGKELKREIKVRDHNHFTGEYRGAAHTHCNLNCRKPLILIYIIIFKDMMLFSLLKNYQRLKVTYISCIPSTEERFISFLKKIKVDEYKSRKTNEW